MGVQTAATNISSNYLSCNYCTLGVQPPYSSSPWQDMSSRHAHRNSCVPNLQVKPMGSLSGSTFRSLFRLYLTVGTITLFWSFLAYLGAFEPVRPYVEKHRAEYFPGAWPEKNPPRL